MKLTIQKSFEFVIDTAKERKRIKEGFRGMKETKQKLNELMDLVEAGEWDKALKQLEGKWWQGRCDKKGYPRLEYIGLLECNHPEVNHWETYINLIIRMSSLPNIYKLVKKS